MKNCDDKMHRESRYARLNDRNITIYKYIERSYDYHKGALAPLYIGIVVVGQHRSHTFGKSAFLWQ